MWQPTIHMLLRLTFQQLSFPILPLPREHHLASRSDAISLQWFTISQPLRKKQHEVLTAFRMEHIYAASLCPPSPRARYSTESVIRHFSSNRGHVKALRPSYLVSYLRITRQVYRDAYLSMLDLRPYATIAAYFEGYGLRDVHERHREGVDIQLDLLS